MSSFMKGTKTSGFDNSGTPTLVLSGRGYLAGADFVNGGTSNRTLLIYDVAATGDIAADNVIAVLSVVGTAGAADHLSPSGIIPVTKGIVATSAHAEGAWVIRFDDLAT